MVVLGGAGPVHAYGIALKLKINKVICPQRAGVLSALGFLVAPASFELSRSYVAAIKSLDIDLVNQIYDEMEAEGVSLLEKVGVRAEQISCKRIVGARYVGQGYEIEIPVPLGALSLESLDEIEQSFNAEYKRIYNRLNENVAIEFIDWRTIVSGPKPNMDLSSASNTIGESPGNNALKGHRRVYFPEYGDYVRAPVYDRYQIQLGMVLEGPAVVEEKESTLIIGPKGKAEVDQWGNIIMTIAN
jgi:N-methylhydantoinase A